MSVSEESKRLTVDDVVDTEFAYFLNDIIPSIEENMRLVWFETYSHPFTNGPSWEFFGKYDLKEIEH